MNVLKKKNKLEGNVYFFSEFGDSHINELVNVCTMSWTTQLMLTPLNQSGQDLKVNCISGYYNLTFFIKTNLISFSALF